MSTPPNTNSPENGPLLPGLPESAARLNELLASLWSRSRSTVAERLQALRQALHSLEADAADPQARKLGADAAHKLAGILGTFGLPRGTELARQAEVLLESEPALQRQHLLELKAWVEELQDMIEHKSLDVPPPAG